VIVASTPIFIAVLGRLVLGSESTGGTWDRARLFGVLMVVERGSGESWPELKPRSPIL
jgi:hypothetical protein